MNKIEKQKEVIGLYFHNLIASDGNTKVSFIENGEQIDKKFTVNDKLKPEDFFEIKKLIHLEGISINILYDDDSSEVITVEEAFHIAAMLIEYNKKRDFLMKEKLRRAEHTNNKAINFNNKVIKRRNKKKGNKKYKK